MRKAFVAACFLLGLAALVFVILRNSRIFYRGGANAEGTHSETASGRKGMGTRANATAGRNTRVSLNLETLRQAAEDSEKGNSASSTPAARDQDYERLLAEKPRDQKYEAEILSRLLDAFSDRQDVSVGEVACNADFCRAEIAGSPEADLLKQHGKTLLRAVNPVGSLFFLSDKDETSTRASCYFARDAYWTAPDFAQRDHLRP